MSNVEIVISLFFSFPCIKMIQQVKHVLLFNIFLPEVKHPHFYDCPVVLYVKMENYCKCIMQFHHVIDLIDKQLGNGRVLIATSKRKECLFRKHSHLWNRLSSFPWIFISHLFLALGQVLILEIRYNCYSNTYTHAHFIKVRTNYAWLK